MEDASFTNWAVGSPEEGANLADCAMMLAEQVIPVMHSAMMPMTLITYCHYALYHQYHCNDTLYQDALYCHSP